MANNAACVHGTFVAGVLAPRRGSTAPPICPSCTLLVRPILRKQHPSNGQMPNATVQDLTMTALMRTRVYTASRTVFVMPSAGNKETLDSRTITRHPGAIPVLAYDLRERPVGQSNLGRSIGRRGAGPARRGGHQPGCGSQTAYHQRTNAASPFVTEAAALLWSVFPNVSAAELKFCAHSETHSWVPLCEMPGQRINF
jgi:hypothetical protein